MAHAFNAPWFLSWSAVPTPQARTALPVKRRPPVFIHDAVTPCNGETLLLTLLRPKALSDNEADQP